jgi:hypothetical protein
MDNVEAEIQANSLQNDPEAKTYTFYGKPLEAAQKRSIRISVTADRSYRQFSPPDIFPIPRNPALDFYPNSLSGTLRRLSLNQFFFQKDRKK